MRLPFAEQEPIRCAAADDGLSHKQRFVHTGQNKTSQALVHRHMQPELCNNGPILLAPHRGGGMGSGILPPLSPFQGTLTQYMHLLFLVAFSYLEQ